MCTAANYLTKCRYFGRNFDYEISYNERVTITPRNYPLIFRDTEDIENHYGIIGIAAGIDEYPLYYDACNEKGLAMGGLNFPDYCDYKPLDKSKVNIASFEIIPYILSQAKTISDAERLLENLNISDEKFSAQLPPSPLHWIISDKEENITVEFMKDGLHIYDNPVGVLTNNPPFETQMFLLNQYMGLSASQPDNRFSGKVPLELYSRGMGAIGLPGDLSSTSRFARAAFVKLNSIAGESENECVNQFFHIMDTIIQPRGCCEVKNGEYEISIYTSCCNAAKGIYYYKTYDNSRIAGIDMHKEDFDGTKCVCYKPDKTDIFIQN